MSEGPVVQSVSLGLRALTALTVLGAGVWLFSGIRRVPPDSTAVVYRFGAISRVHDAGLLLALPPPVETVDLLPGPARQISQTVQTPGRPPGLDTDYTRASGVPASGAAGVYLTGDGNTVLLDATLTWRIADPAAFAVARDHVAPALDRLFRAAAVDVAARQRLDDFLVAAPGHAGASQSNATIRQAVIDAMLDAMNKRLAALDAAGAPLGVAVDRIDLAASLPPEAKLAYDQLLTQAQVTDQGIALSRTDALRQTQSAIRDAQAIVEAAHAAAAERVSAATSMTSPIVALETEAAKGARPGLMLDAYRVRAAAILKRAGAVTAVDPAGGNRLIVPATQP